VYVADTSTICTHVFCTHVFYIIVEFVGFDGSILMRLPCDQPPPFNGPGVTRERVLTIAAKYGLQDSIAVGYKSTTLKPPPPETYQ
jgi:hypothetical protein